MGDWTLQEIQFPAQPAKKGGGRGVGKGARQAKAAKTPPASRIYKKEPSLADITSDPFVDFELKRAWNESKPNAPDVKRGDPGSQKQEQGGWVVWNKKTGKLEVIRVPAGTRDGLATIGGTRPADSADQKVVGWFHTHPNKASEDYMSDPSQPDKDWQKAEAKVPGIIETHDGRKTIPHP